MKCWKCSETINDSVKTCPNCGASVERTTPVTAEGEVLRRIDDDFGAKVVLHNVNLLISSIKDLLYDSEDLCRYIQLSYESGLGELYYSRIIEYGLPDEEFNARIKDLLLSKAGLSETESDKIIELFNEMIGWKQADKSVNEDDVNRSSEAASESDKNKSIGYSDNRFVDEDGEFDNFEFDESKSAFKPVTKPIFKPLPNGNDTTDYDSDYADMNKSYSGVNKRLLVANIVNLVMWEAMLIWLIYFVPFPYSDFDILALDNMK